MSMRRGRGGPAPRLAPGPPDLSIKKSGGGSLQAALVAAEARASKRAALHPRRRGVCSVCWKQVRARSPWEPPDGGAEKRPPLKGETLIAEVLAPYSVEMILSFLISHHAFYSLCTEPWQHNNNNKMFPLVLRSFDLKNGISNYLLDF